MMLLVMTGIVPVLVLIDVLLKSFVEMNVSRGSEHRIFHDRIIIRKVYNRGMFLNALEDRPGLVNILSLVSTGILTVYQGICLLLQKSARMSQRLSEGIHPDASFTDPYH